MKIFIFICALSLLAASLKIDLERRLIKEPIQDRIDRQIKEGRLKMMTIDELRADAMLKEKNFGDNPVIELKNYQDLQYYGPAFIGSKNQEFSMVYDTGSEWFWIPNKGCNGCPNKNAFEAASSDTFVDTGVNQELVYGQGHVTGNIGTDMIGIGKDDAAQMRFVLVDFAEDKNTQKPNIKPIQNVIKLPIPTPVNYNPFFYPSLHSPNYFPPHNLSCSNLPPKIPNPQISQPKVPKSPSLRKKIQNFA